MNSLTINPGKLSLRDLRQVLQAACHVTLSDDAAANIEKSVACVNDIVKANRTTYGINTGFGWLASTHIEQHDLEKLQRSIVLSHAAGVGAALGGSAAGAGACGIGCLTATATASAIFAGSASRVA